MFIINNLTTNALQMDDNTMLAPFDRRTVEEKSKMLRDYEKRGWISIIEDKPAEEKPADTSSLKTPENSVGGKK